MKFLVIGYFYQESFANHISETLQVMGHSVISKEVGLGGKINESFASKRINNVIRKIDNVMSSSHYYKKLVIKDLKKALSKKIDIVIVCHNSFLWPREVEEIKTETDGDVVLWHPDHIGQMGKAYCISAPYDKLFFKDPYIVNRINEIKEESTFYLPECFSKRRHSMQDEKEAEEKYKCQVTTAGNLHPYRVELFKALEEYDVKIWGNPPPVWGKLGPVREMFQDEFVANEEKASAFMSAKIVVNNLKPSEIYGVNVRTFEAAGIGAFQLVNWRPGLDQLFEVGSEIATFRTVRELKEKVDYYLNHPGQRDRMSTAAKKRAMKEHTYEDRLSTLIDTVRGEASGWEIILEGDLGVRGRERTEK